MIRYMNKYLIVALVTSMFLATSCTKEEVYNPEISVVNSTNKDVSTASQGYPGDLIVAEGIELDKMDSVLFVTDADSINVVFNPALNSSIAIMFEVPYDETKGSKLGMQKIYFINKNGKEVMQDFEILQPDPEISGFLPERPKAGGSTVIVGKWFMGLESVTFAGEPADYEYISSTQILLRVPQGAEPADVVVTTNIGSSTKNLDVDLGYNVYRYNDFDGGGMYATNDWRNNGDITDAVVFSDVDGFDGNYAEFTWSGSTSNGWGNAEPTSGMNPGITETNQEKVKFVFEVYCSSPAGSTMQIQIDDGTTVWAHNYDFTAEEVGKWITVEMLSYDFGAGYDPGNVTHSMDCPNINYVKVAINQWGPVPTIVRVDNMRFYEYY